MKTLPNSLSKLLRVAIADLRKVRKDPRYTIDPDTWHSPNQKTCEVCMAGAIMAKTLKVKNSDCSYPGDFSPIINRKLVALDMARNGDIVWALKQMSPQTKLTRKQHVVINECAVMISKTLYSTLIHGLAPAKVYLEAADLLESVGL